MPPDNGGSPIHTGPRAPAPRCTATRSWVNTYAAGLDSSSDETWAYVPDDRDTAPVRSFGPCTPDLDALVDGLATCWMETVTIALTIMT